MDIQKPIVEIKSGDDIEGCYILKDSAVRTSSTGKPYFAGNIADKTGQMDIKMWDYSGPLTPSDSGKVVKLRGKVSEYQGSLQMIASQLALLAEGETYDRSALTETAPIDIDAAENEIRSLIASMADIEYRSLAEYVFERQASALRLIPAAKSVHHAFPGGLLMHTLNMLRIADFLAGLYSSFVDRDLLLCGTLMHDLAKREEFSISDLGLVSEYTVEGQLIGHPVLGAEETEKAAAELGVGYEKTLLLKHMLLSHHGKPEFGAAVVPMTAEAELLSMIDLTDSRLEIYRTTLDSIEPGTFSQRVFALDKKVYRHK
jgi:3'-5' exoribonuclease